MAILAIMYLLLLPLLLCMNSCASAYLLQSNETDQEALLLFKNKLEGNPLMSWNSSIHFCQWQGVTCNSSSHQRIIALELPGEALVGSLSPYIANFTFLNALDLSNNSFTGPVPKVIGRLSNLRALNLARNSFHGELTINVTNCQRLQELRLQYNKFVGRNEFGSLSKVSVLRLDYNSLTGSIPSTFGNLTSLVQLSLTNCGLEGSIPDVLGNISSLQAFQVGLNNLSEYGMGVKTSIHGDVYSYGILLLEMFTGKRPTDEMFKDGRSLHSMAKQALQEEVPMMIVDPKLLLEVKLFEEGSNPNKITYKMTDSLHDVLKIGLQCSLDSPTERMDMKAVVQALRTISNECTDSEK